MISRKSSIEWPSPKGLELLKKQRIQASIGKPVVAFGHILYYFAVDLVLEPYAQRIGSWLAADVLRRRFCLCEPTLRPGFHCGSAVHAAEQRGSTDTHHSRYRGRAPHFLMTFHLPASAVLEQRKIQNLTFPGIFRRSVWIH